MPDTPPRSRQQMAIRQQWPRTAKQLESTYFPEDDWAMSTTSGRNHAGYMIWALTQMEAKAQANLTQRNFTREELDLAASREIYYQWIHDRRFSHTDAALATCLVNLVIERPEKLLEARRLLAGQAGRKEWSTKPNSSGQLTETRSSSPGQEKRGGTPTPIASDLRELMHPNLDQLQSQGQQRLSYASAFYVFTAPCESSQLAVGQTATAALSPESSTPPASTSAARSSAMDTQLFTASTKQGD